VVHGGGALSSLRERRTTSFCLGFVKQVGSILQGDDLTLLLVPAVFVQLSITLLCDFTGQLPHSHDKIIKAVIRCLFGHFVSSSKARVVANVGWMNPLLSAEDIGDRLTELEVRLKLPGRRADN
jgi:hypothetical protein